MTPTTGFGPGHCVRLLLRHHSPPPFEPLQERYERALAHWPTVPSAGSRSQTGGAVEPFWDCVVSPEPEADGDILAAQAEAQMSASEARWVECR